MPRYQITFSGRSKGAIGLPCIFCEVFDAESPEAARRALYARFDHVGTIGSHYYRCMETPENTPIGSFGGELDRV